MSSRNNEPVPDAVPSNGPPSSDHVGQHQQGGHGHGRGQGPRTRNQNSAYIRHNQARFEGREPALKGFIYDLSSIKSPDHYLRTTKEIANHVGHMFKKNTAAFVEAIEDFSLTLLTEPEAPEDANAIAIERWKLALKRYDEQTEAYQDYLANSYSLVLGRCTETLEDKI